MSEIYSIIVYDINVSIHFMPDSACRGVVPPIPELTSGRKVKGTETRCHTMMEIGTSLMTGRMHTIHYYSDTPVHAGCGRGKSLG